MFEIQIQTHLINFCHERELIEQSFQIFAILEPLFTNWHRAVIVNLVQDVLTFQTKFYLKLPFKIWSFSVVIEPKQIDLNIDGKTDPCSKGEDLNFKFSGFAVKGQVSTFYTLRLEWCIYYAC